jgi:histidyl-tRNA synthetase
MRHADALGAEYAAIIGKRELAAGTATLRRLADGHQETLALGELTGHLGGSESLL